MIVTPILYYWYKQKEAAELHLWMCNMRLDCLCYEMMGSAEIELFYNKQYKLRLKLII
jgi:hypothetical protein